MRYRRDVPRDDPAAIDAEIEHVRAHLSACATPDDDPDARAGDVYLTAHADGDPNMVGIVGEIDAEPIAPYLRDDFEPDDDGADLPVALDREPVDLTPDEYEAHMTRKERR